MPTNTYLDLLAKYSVDSAHPGGMPLTQELLSTLPIDRNTVLIDLGCGTGSTLAYIAKTYNCKAVGVDCNDQMLSKAAQRFGSNPQQIAFVRADVMQLPFPPGIFDIALSESVTIFTDIDIALKEYTRILKKDGILVAIEMTAVSSLSVKELNEITSVYGIRHVPSTNEWHQMFRQAGFKNVQVYDAKPKPISAFSSLPMVFDFLPHLHILYRYGRKLKFKVYVCTN